MAGPGAHRRNDPIRLIQKDRLGAGPRTSEHAAYTTNDVPQMAIPPTPLHRVWQPLRAMTQARPGCECQTRPIQIRMNTAFMPRLSIATLPNHEVDTEPQNETTAFVEDKMGHSAIACHRQKCYPTRGPRNHCRWLNPVCHRIVTDCCFSSLTLAFAIGARQQ